MAVQCSGPSQSFQAAEVVHGVPAAIVLWPAHFWRGLQLRADRGPPRLTKDLAAPMRIQLHTRNTRRLALRHAINRRADRWGNTAGAAAGATGQAHRGHKAHI